MLQEEPKVLIIGAGLTGLFIAQGLKKHGIAYEIFESEEDPAIHNPSHPRRRKEWTMGVHWGLPLMEKLLPAGFAERLIPEACVDASLDYITLPENGSRIYDGVTGQVLKELVSEGKLLRVSRRKLRALCLEGVAVNWGWKLRDVECEDGGGGVTAVFENGETVRGTVVIGTDGPGSVVRTHLFEHDVSAEAKPLEGIVHLAATFSYGDAERSRLVRTAHPVWSMSLHPDVFCYVCIQDVPSPERPEEWTFFVFVCWLGEKDPTLSTEQVKELAKQKAEGLSEPFRSAILWIPDHVELDYVDIRRWVSKPWDSKGGRVSLAGDAAHPMPPYRGQGLNHAILDASNVVEVMRKVKEDESKQGELLKQYSDEVAKRGAEETELSTKNAYMLLAYDDFKESPYMKHGLSKQ